MVVYLRKGVAFVYCSGRGGADEEVSEQRSSTLLLALVLMLMENAYLMGRLVCGPLLRELKQKEPARIARKVHYTVPCNH